jgi:predicted DNA-binding protein YlxM (UPF0122 family)
MNRIGRAEAEVERLTTQLKEARIKLRALKNPPKTKRYYATGHRQEIFNLYNNGISLSELSVKFQVTKSRIGQIIRAEERLRASKAMRKAEMLEFYSIFTRKTSNILKSNGITSMWHLSSWSLGDIKKWKNCGPDVVSEIKKVLKKNGMSLKKEYRLFILKAPSPEVAQVKQTFFPIRITK